MAESQVQLKREEIVGDEVVLSDINPSTTSDSVTHSTNGLPLDEELSRIWNSINDKLSRVVNSVNARTGVVVLTAEDVGLGNVDNMSFAEIQDWVIERMKQEFSNRAFKLFTYLDEADNILAANDKSMAGCGFYASKGRQQDNDNRSYIGVFWWDNASQTLQTSTKSIQVIGATDSSVLYDEKAGSRDYRQGKLGINIWKDEDGLEIYEGASADPNEPKANSGLRLVRNKIVPSFEAMQGCYGSDFQHPGTADDSWLYADTHPNDAPTVRIIYDGKDLTTNSVFYAKRVFREKDQFICCFSNMYGYSFGEHGAHDMGQEELNLPAGVDPLLVNQHDAIGIVSDVVKDVNDNVTSYTVTFTPIVPRVGGGIVYENYYKKYGTRYPEDYKECKHNNGLRINTPEGAIAIGDVYSDILDPSQTPLADNYFNLLEDNVSGLTIRHNRDERNTNGQAYTPSTGGYAFTNLPIGPFPIGNPKYSSSDVHMEGISITPDSSLCIVSSDFLFNSSGTSKTHYTLNQSVLNSHFIDTYTPEGSDHSNMQGTDGAVNWAADAEYYYSDTSSRLGRSSLLGINLNKAKLQLTREDGQVFDQSKPALANISGLRVYQYAQTVDGRIFGGENINDIPEKYAGTEMTGGLAINCGKYLKIEPDGFHGDCEKFYDGGKLTLDLGMGFIDDDGKLSLSISTGKGLKQYTDQQGIERLGINLLRSGMIFKYSPAIGENGALTLTNSHINHNTGIILKEVVLTDSEADWFDESGNDYDTQMGVKYAHIFGLRNLDGIEIDENNFVSVKNYTFEYVRDASGNKVIDDKGYYKRKKVYHGLQFYGESCGYSDMPGIDDHDYEPTKTGMNMDGLGVKVKDADGTSHGLEINEEGTLCVEEKTEVYKRWTIEGTQVTFINGVEADRAQKEYDYIPNRDALTIKLGKGLIFADERDPSVDPDNPDECPCGCGCVNYDNGAGGSSTTFEIYDYIESDGRQKIDSIAVTFNSTAKHIIQMSYVLDTSISQEVVLFEVGRNNNSGTQTIGAFVGAGSKVAPKAQIIENASNLPVTTIDLNQTDAGTMEGLRYDTTVTFQPTMIEATWIDTSAHPDVVTPTAATVLGTSTPLSDKLMSLFGPSAVDNVNKNAKIKFYGLKLYEDDLDHCIAEFVPCRSSAGYYGIFDRVNKRFYRNNSTDTEQDFTPGQPTGEVINGKGEPVTPPDPATLVTYDLLEFIQSNGHQRIATSVQFNSSTSSHYIIPEIQTAGLNDQIFYSIGDLGTVGAQFGGVSDGKKQFGIMDLSGGSSVVYSISQDPADVTTANPMIFDGYALYEKERLFIKWIEDNSTAHLTHVTDSKDDFTVSSGGLLRLPLSLFAGVLNSETSQPSSIYMYGFKVAENDPANIIADFVPCISSNNEIGLFDFISKTFVKKTDDSSDFTAGNRTGRRIDYRGNYI